MAETSVEFVVTQKLRRPDSTKQGKKMHDRKADKKPLSSELPSSEESKPLATTTVTIPLPLLKPSASGNASEASRPQRRSGSSVIREAQAMGFSSDQILNALVEMEIRGSSPVVDLNAEQLLQLIIDLSYGSGDSFQFIPERETCSLSHVEQQTEPEDLDYGKDCIICMEDEAVMAFIPCGHVKTCTPCSDLVFSCPVCRKRIRNRMRVYP